MRYSRTTGGFYPDGIDYPNLPTDLVEITDDQHATLLASQASGQTIQADANGYPIAVGPTFAQTQQSQIVLIQSACQAAIYAGFSSSALGATHTYPAKATDQLNLNGSVTASLLPSLPSGWTTPFWCEDSTGTWAYLPHTAAQIQQVGSDGKAAILANLSKCQNYIAEIMAATTVADVQKVVWQ